MLYKFTTSAEVARLISIGIFRFYDLTKYIRIEDVVGRSDPRECSVSFLPEEYMDNPEKLPTASFNGVEFKCSHLGFDEQYISQYFVFCMSTDSAPTVMGDATHIVELDQDIFATIGLLLNDTWSPNIPSDYKFYSHGEVEYYDIENHPSPIGVEYWREVYIKHASFRHQKEYRAAIFAHARLFHRLSTSPLVVARPIYQSGVRLDFDLRLSMTSGIDTDGWRYIEIDISEFSEKFVAGPCRVIDIEFLQNNSTDQ